MSDNGAMKGSGQPSLRPGKVEKNGDDGEENPSPNHSQNAEAGKSQSSNEGRIAVAAAPMTNAPSRGDHNNDDAEELKSDSSSVEGYNPAKDSQGERSAPDGVVQTARDALPVNVAMVDSMLGGDGWFELDKDERSKCEEALADYRKMLSEAEMEKRTKEFYSFVQDVVRLIDMLAKVSNTILRLFPSSRIPKSTQAIRDTLLSLTFYIRCHSLHMSDLEAFFDDIRKAMKDSGKTTKLKDTGVKSSQRMVSKSIFPPDDFLYGSVENFLGFLHENVGSFSKDLRVFLDHMKVGVNDEVDDVYDAASDLSAFAKHWMTSSSRSLMITSQVYVHDFMLKVVGLVETLSNALGSFIDKGLPEIEELFKDQEKRTQIESLAILTGATFFSSITASTLSLSLTQRSTLYDVVNFFWFTSLVFSIGSVMNSLVTFTWQHSIFRKRASEEQLPFLIAFWSRESPLYFFIVSALTFIVGLCLLAYASGQARWTSTATTIFTGLSILGIVGTAAWFIAEIYRRRASSSELDDTGSSDLGVCKHLLGVVIKHLHSVRGRVIKAMGGLLKFRTSLGIVTTHVGNVIWCRSNADHLSSELESGLSRPHRDSAAEDMPEKAASELEGRPPSPSSTRLIENTSSPYATSVTSKTPDVIKKLIRSLESLTAVKLDLGLEKQSIFDRLGISISIDGSILGVVRSNLWLLYHFPNNTIIRATAGNKPSMGETFKNKIVWSPKSDAFLLRSTIGIQIWRAVGKGRPNVEFTDVGTVVMPYANAELLTWYPNGDFFCCVDGSSVKKFAANGFNRPILEGSFDLEVEKENCIINDAFIFADTQTYASPRLIMGVTTIITMKSTSSTKSRSSRFHHELIVYDVENRTIESRTPLFGRVASFCLSKNNSELLIGYLDKPPQLWNIVLAGSTLTCDLRQSYHNVTRTKTSNEDSSNSPVGRSFFLGPNENFVFCWVQSKGCQVWDKASAVPLVFIDQSNGVDYIWSIAHGPHMLASTSIFGDILVWKMSKEDVVSNDVEEQEGDDEGEGEDAAEISIVPR